jgi:lysophospholipid acyltransferase
MCRAGFRPLVLPPPGAPTTLTKRVYDFLGTFASILLLNYVAAPFMLLTYSDSLKAWSRLGWYGFWIVGSGFAFFKAGGSTYLQGLQKQQAKVAVDASKLQTPGPHVVPPLDSAAFELRARVN